MVTGLKISHLLLPSFFLLTIAAPAWATVLPDACGEDTAEFKVETQPAPLPLAAPEAGKAEIVFIETFDKTGFSFFSGQATTRIGVDGAWVGANHGDSYFTVGVMPGEHHLCANWQSNSDSERKKVGVTMFTAEVGKIYYYQVKITVRIHPGKPCGSKGTQCGGYTERSLDLTELNEDDAKYRIKVSPQSTATPKY
jgi:hypothetical protein